MQCFAWVLLVAAAVMVLVTILRWFEQITEAVEQGWWRKVVLLVVIPPSVWLYPSRVSAGRPTAVPHHEPVRGFGKVPLNPEAKSPGPIAPVKKPVKRSSVDPDQLAKLKQKMIEQGMLDDQ
jgi:hypothetical protein